MEEREAKGRGRKKRTGKKMELIERKAKEGDSETTIKKGAKHAKKKCGGRKSEEQDRIRKWKRYANETVI